MSMPVITTDGQHSWPERDSRISAGFDPYSRGRAMSPLRGEGEYSRGPIPHYSNGYNSDQHSDSNDDGPLYLMEHLATFSVGPQYGLHTPKDGLRRLLQMEKSKGIWTQKMQMRLEKKWVVIIDNENGDIVERFPMSLISEPTAYTSDDPRELYNNILIFVVKGDPKNKNHSPSEMHIFQCARIKAHVIVDEMKLFMSGKWKRLYKDNARHIPPPPANPPPDPPANALNVKEHVNMYNSASGSPRQSAMNRTQGGSQQRIDRVERTSSYGKESNDETSSTSSDKYEKDVAILNHCFDDIERFIARLQHAAAAFKELERRRKSRKNKKKDMGDGMLSMRAKPPPERQFVDILQKFKLSFNLLAKLKSHIHDPNAPELVHFLFTPLALIVDAAKDSHYSSNLPARVVTPLMTREAIDLLLNCCTSKETDLWQSLGEPWIIPRENWKGYEGNYHPIFSDGWAPEYPFSEDRERAELTAAAAASAAQRFRRDEIRQAQEEAELREREYHRVSAQPDRDSRYGSEYYYSSECGDRDRSGSPAVPSERIPIHQSYDNRQYDSHHLEMPRRDIYAERGAPPSPLLGRDYQDRDARSEISAESDPVTTHIDPYRQFDRQQQQWLEDLRVRGAKIVQVMYPRTANNDKELTVVRGECLEVLDDSRKWWKARNIRGQIGHVPHTIVTLYTGGVVEDDVFNNPLYATRGGREYYSPSGSPVESGPPMREHFSTTSSNPVPPTGPVDWVRRERQGKKDSTSSLHGIGESSSPIINPSSKLDGRIEAVPLPSSPKPSRTVHSPPPPPPPPTVEKTPPKRPAKPQKQPKDPQNMLQEELKERMTLGPKAHKKLASIQQLKHMHCIYITSESSPLEVQSWLEVKGFSPRTMQVLKEMGGRNMFDLTKDQMEKYLGHEEGARLHSHITVQKNICGYKSESQQELRCILDKRREQVDQGSKLPDEAVPSTSSQKDTAPKNTSEDDINPDVASKTLRYLLRDQRKKLNQFEQDGNSEK